MASISAVKVHVSDSEVMELVTKLAEEYAARRLPKGVSIGEVLMTDFEDDGYIVVFETEE